MKIIIPMAGRGTRLRPHTLSVPKPLVKIAGISIVHRLVEDLVNAIDEKIEEIAFIIGDFGEAVEKDLLKLAEQFGAKGSIYFQQEKLGTAHAILCARESISGKTIIAFADTLFHSEIKINTQQDGLIWVQKVDDPSAYGVVKLNKEGSITEFVEKPDEFVSDLAIIGIYYFRDGDQLKEELQYLLDNDIMKKGEFQLTDALENMKQKGADFRTHTINEWLDCGNKDALIYANQRVLINNQKNAFISEDLELENAVLIPPCYIEEGVKISHSVIGPYVSIQKGTMISNAQIKKSMIGSECRIDTVLLDNAMIGDHVSLEDVSRDLSLGDYSVIKV